MKCDESGKTTGTGTKLCLKPHLHCISLPCKNSFINSSKMFYYYHHLDFSAAECITYEECKFRFCIDERTELKDVKKQCV